MTVRFFTMRKSPNPLIFVAKGFKQQIVHYFKIGAKASASRTPKV
jgi:hypothetical protein